jgi:D-xylulose reductase
MSAEDGALVEPVAVAVQIGKVAELKAGQTVLVLGCGPIGVLCQAVAKAAGASKVIGVDISESRAQFARAFAADEVYVNNTKPAEGEDPVDAARAVGEKIVAEYGVGEGFDVVLECTGAEPCIQAGIFAARKGGMYVQAGMGRENVVFPITTACIRALTVKGSIRYSTGCYPQAVQLVASGKVQPRKLITHRFKFEQAEEAFELVRQAGENTLKVVIEGVQN